MKLFASDYDGTLYQNKKIDQKLIDKINEFRKDNLFGIATGRCVDLVKCELDGQGVPYDFIVSNNGGTIVDKDGKLLVNHLIDRDVAKSIMQIVGSYKPDQLGVSDGLTYATNYPMLETLMPSLADYEYQKPDVFKVIEKGDIASIFAYFDSRVKTKEVLNKINGYIADLECATNLKMISITPKNVTKKQGVEFVAKYFKADEIYVIGDDFNDLPMIEYFHGFAISSGIEDCIKKASKTFDNVYDALVYLMS